MLVVYGYVYVQLNTILRGGNQIIYLRYHFMGFQHIPGFTGKLSILWSDICWSSE